MAYGKKGVCPHGCGATAADQHSNREAGICAALRNPSIKVGEEMMVKAPRTKRVKAGAR